MSDWYQRQFGDRAQFALAVSLGRDPHPAGPPERDASWGTLSIWADGHCLTASMSDDGVREGVRWNLLPILEWFMEVGIRLVNEDPYPRFSHGIDVADGCAWFDATLSPPILSDEAERRWFLRRSEWRHFHALRRSSEDVALPNVVFKRTGDQIEISWDNESWPPPRADLTFVKQTGRALVAADDFAAVVRSMLTDVTRALAERFPLAPLQRLGAQAAGAAAGPTDWRWLIHRPTAEIIRNEMSALCNRLDEATGADAEYLFVPHTAETRALRLVRLESRGSIEAVLEVSGDLARQPLSPEVQELIRPRPAAHRRPWIEGNEYAEDVRDALGWSSEPLPELHGWLASQGCRVIAGNRGLPASVSVVAGRTDDARTMAHVNPNGRSRRQRETGLATALGHLLMDPEHVAMDGDWEHWPTSARARAFGVALTLPEEGLRDALGGTSIIGAEEVEQLMTRYRAGPFATTYRLRNLGLITPDQQVELAQQFV